MSKVYQYIGPHELQRLLDQPSDRMRILRPEDLRIWLSTTQQKMARLHSVTATFIIDTTGHLWIADRHSEHVACAAGQEVLTAGEITFTIEHQQLSVSEITNQSTGYCPEPETWAVVAATLDAIGIEHPASFTTSFIFRRCTACGTINIVKEGIFECGVCETALSREWNL
jgi:hypothetical protein